MIKKLSLISLFTLLPASFYYAQTTVYAYIKDDAGKPIENAEIDLAQSDNDVTADKIGYFQFVDMQPGKYLITVSRQNFESKIVEFEVNKDERRKDLGVITLSIAPVSAGVMVIDDSGADADDGGSSMQPTVGLLGASRDVFQSVSAFELGAYWFRPRGMENRYEEILFNGVSMSKNDDGRVDFSNWGGLNDVTRYPYENADNLNPSEYTFGNLGGVVYYNTRASSYRKQTSLAYSFTNRSYFHRAMATYSSGLTKNGWAFTVSGSRRWADEGVIEGTYQDSYAYFAAIEKQFSSRHALNLTAFGAPTYRASNSPNTQEAYDLMGKNYNSYWGWQDGEKRNSRIRRVFEPVFMLTDYLKIGENSNWNNTLSYQFGRDARSRLDWFHAKDPNPTYYRNLPGYLFSTFERDNSDGGVAITDAEQAQFDAYVLDWKNNPNRSQIDWNSLYAANINNRYDMAGNEQGAIYTIVNDVNEDKTLNFNSHFDTKLASNWKLNLNFNYQNLKSDNFREMKDLLGAFYANDLNAFNNDAPHDMDNPGRKIMEGDRTQYSYDLLKNTYAFNASTEVDFAKWNLVASVFSSYSESQRDGHFRHAVFNSKGKSDVYTSLDAGLKGRITYKINGKNFIVYNGAFFSLAPTLNEIFISPRVTNMITPSVKNQIVSSNDLTYILRGQIVKLRLGAYLTNISNATDVSRYYVDISSETADQGNALVAEILNDVDKTYKGVEMGAEVKITPTLSATAVASIGDYRITNNPTVTTFDDDYGYRNDWGQANVKDYKVAGTPQKAYSFGLRYNSTKFWWIGASANYLQDQYLDFSALNKTKALYTNPATGDLYDGVTPEAVAFLTKQQKFEDQFMLNANVGKSFLFGKYRMGVSVSVNNILNNRDYVTGGFEQGRNVNFPESYADATRTYPHFGPKLWYDRGRTFFANVYLRF